MKNRKLCAVLAAVMCLALLLTACGGDPQTNNPGTNNPGTNDPSTNNPTGSQGGGTGGGPSGDYVFRTSKDNPVVTENGTFTKDNVSGPILITSIGQSADVSMLNALMGKIEGVEYDFDQLASAEAVAGYKTMILACGASSKGLGAAGISQEDEIARAEAIVKAAKDNNITVIVAHLGGVARRGALSDQFNDLALSCASYILVVEDGNDDGKFTDAAVDAGIPITLINSIKDAQTPLADIFG